MFLVSDFKYFTINRKKKHEIKLSISFIVFEQKRTLSGLSAQRINLTRNRTVFTVLDRPRKSSPEILKNST